MFWSGPPARHTYLEGSLLTQPAYSHNQTQAVTAIVSQIIHSVFTPWKPQLSAWKNTDEVLKEKLVLCFESNMWVYLCNGKDNEYTQ